MNPPDVAAILAALEATWPPAARERVGAWWLRDCQGGGKRVSAATPAGPDAAESVEAAEAEMTARGLRHLFRIGPADLTLDAALVALGYALSDPTLVFFAPVEALQNPRQPPLSAVPSEMTLRIASEIWAGGGIGPERRAIIERAAGPKTWLLARVGDRAGGAGFAAIHGDVAMVHALEVRPAFRRMGAGRAMIHRAAAWAHGHGAEHLGLAVTEANEPANALYAALGMRVAGRYHYRRKPE